MVDLLVNGEKGSSYQANTDSYLNLHGYQMVCNDYRPDGTSLSVVRLQFQPPTARQPVFLIINAVTNSPSHKAYELLANEEHYGQTDFTADIQRWRALINSVLPPPPPPRLLSPAYTTEGQFQFRLDAPSNQMFRVEYSSNLIDWSTLATNIPGGTPNPLIIDRSTPSASHRFYRVVQE